MAPTQYWAEPEASKKDGRNGGVAFIPVYFGYCINFPIPLTGDWLEQLHLFIFNCIKPYFMSSRDTVHSASLQHGSVVDRESRRVKQYFLSCPLPAAFRCTVFPSPSSRIFP